MKIFITILLLIFVVESSAQFREREEDPRINLMRGGNQTSFLDINNFSIDHSFQASYSSSSNYSYMSNEYVAGINYKFAKPLTMRVELGASYVPYSSFNIDDDMRSDIYLKSATLQYKPYKDMSITLSYSNLKGFYDRGYFYTPFEKKNRFGNYYIEDGE